MYIGKTVSDFPTGRDRTVAKRTGVSSENLCTLLRDLWRKRNRFWTKPHWGKQQKLFRTKSWCWRTLKNLSKRWRRLLPNRPCLCQAIISAQLPKRSRKKQRRGPRSQSLGLWMLWDPAAEFEVGTLRTSTVNLELLPLTLCQNPKEPFNTTRRQTTLQPTTVSSRVNEISPLYLPYLPHPFHPVLHHKGSVEDHPDELETLITGKKADICYQCHFKNELKDWIASGAFVPHLCI